MGEARDAGLSLCFECIERLVEGDARPRSYITVFGVMGAATGVVAMLIFTAVAPGPRDDPVSPAFGGAYMGLFAGAFLGLVADRIARRREVRLGLDGTSWIAIIEEKQATATKSTTGYAFLGASRFLVAVKGGERRWIRAEDIEATSRMSEKRVALHLRDGPVATNVHIAGPRAFEAAQAMVSGQ